MANLDTQLKRESGLFPVMPWRMPAKPPTGSVVQAERQAIALSYSGIAAASPPPPSGINGNPLYGAFNPIKGYIL